MNGGQKAWEKLGSKIKLQNCYITEIVHCKNPSLQAI